MGHRPRGENEWTRARGTQLRSIVLTLGAISLLAGGLTACGGSSGSGSNAAAGSSHTEAAETGKHSDPDKDGTVLDDPDVDGAPARVSPDRDNDGDAGGSRGPHDSDDTATLDFGRAATNAERLQITALVRRYYAAAAAHDGRTACSLIYSTYAEAIPEDFGTSPPGPSYARGATCAVVTSKVFEHFHSRLALGLPKLKVARVRVKGHQGIAILSFGAALPQREIRVEREARNWRVLGMMDNELP